MTLPRSAAEVISDDVARELESIDRMYGGVSVPQLQREGGVVYFLPPPPRLPVVSSALVDPISEDAAELRFKRL